MRFIIFLCGLAIVATGVAAVFLLGKGNAHGLLYGALQLGGGIIISGLFSLKMKWHGIIAAGVLALLGTARGLSNLPGLLKFAMGDRGHGPAPLLELGVMLISLLLMVRVIQALYQERARRMLEGPE